MRRMIIAGNWKMHTDLEEAEKLAKGIVKKVGGKTEPAVVLCPPYPLLPAVSKIIEGTTVQLGAQNVHPEDQGAFTGEVSASMLKSAGCEYVIVGHSERRRKFLETNNIVNSKVKAVLDSGMVPVLCIGESGIERKSGLKKMVLATQLKKCLDGVAKKDLKNLIVAYEPIWAISTEKNATPQTAESAGEDVEFVKKILKDMFESFDAKIRVVYGGSVTPGNVGALAGMKSIDGFLVGGASLDVKSFLSIVDNS